MKNYYEILEISPKASQEMVGKAYKVLVKRYHPDLQTSQEAKEKCEEKIKEINEAYDVIGDEQKRKEYDAKLEAERQKVNNSQNQNYRQTYNQNQSSNNDYNHNQNNVDNNNQHSGNNSNTNVNSNMNVNADSFDSIRNIHARAQERMRQRQGQNARTQQEMNQQYQKDYQDAINKAYHDAYIQDLKNRGYKIKYKKTLNDYLRSMAALLITIGIIAIVVQIPFVKDFLHDLYEANPFIKGIVDSIANLFK